MIEPRDRHDDTCLAEATTEHGEASVNSQSVEELLQDGEIVLLIARASPWFVFIDGGHSMPAAMADYRNWAARVITDGMLAIHDVFPDPADGGRPPFEIYQLALRSGLFEEIKAVHSLRLLRRL